MQSKERKLIQVGSGRLEVFVHPRPNAPVVLAAHPADSFNEGTAALLADAAQAEVVCINPRGCGGSDPWPDGERVSLEQMVDDLEQARQALGLAPWVFWGISGGGWLAQLYAQRHPGALSALVLESIDACFRVRLGDPACLISPLHPAWRSAIVTAGLLDENAYAAPIVAEQTEWCELPGGVKVLRRVGGPALLVAPMELTPWFRRVMPVLLVAADFRLGAGSLRLPTLVIAGSADAICPVVHSRELHASIAGAELVVVEGAGHVPVTERRPEVSAAVRRLLVGAPTRTVSCE